MSLAIGSGEARTPSGFDQMPGVTAPSSRQPTPGFLTDTILEMGLVADGVIETAIHDSRGRGLPPERILVEDGHLSEDDLARARAEHAGLDYVDLSGFDRDRDHDALFSREAAERHRALPIAVHGRCLVVALADPIDAPVIADLISGARLELVPAVASASAIASRLEELPERASRNVEPAVVEPARLQPIDGGGESRVNPISDGLADRIVERVDAAIDEVARSEILRALDDATAEIERLTAELEQSEERARALERECDELRSTPGDGAIPSPS